MEKFSLATRSFSQPDLQFSVPTMFKIEMKESESGKVSIEDIKHETMAEMLYFIYTGLVKETALTETNVVVELLYATDKYQLATLKDICQDKLRSLLDADNAIEFLILGEKYHATKLKDSAMMEVVHNMPKIADTEDYQISLILFWRSRKRCLSD